MAKKTKKSEQSGWLKKAYNDYEFLNSSAARQIRVLAEFTEPDFRFRKNQVKNTIVFFGSARTLPKEVTKKNLDAVKEKIRSQKKPSKKMLQEKEVAERDLRMSRYYSDTMKLAEKLTKWSLRIQDKRKRFYVCSGGGPGIMEAANRGALNAGGQSIGLNISLPLEQNPNPYQTKEISFEFHYFFIRKFWFFYLSKALVVFPGGFGTFDELFELLTLIQTKKTKKVMPIVIYGKSFWDELIDFNGMVKWGVIDKEDLRLYKFCDDVDEAFHYLIGELTKRYL